MKNLWFFCLLLTSLPQVLLASEEVKVVLATTERIEYCGPEIALGSKYLNWDCANIAVSTIPELKSVVTKGQEETENSQTNPYTFIESDHPNYSVRIFDSRRSAAARYRSVFEEGKYKGVGITTFCTGTREDCIKFQTFMGRRIPPRFCSKLSRSSSAELLPDCEKFVECSPGLSETPVRIVKKARPYYPQYELEQSKSGLVLIKVNVDDKGKLAGLDVLEASGNDQLDQAAIFAVKKWKFEARKCGDSSVSGSFIVPIVFYPH